MFKIQIVNLKRREDRKKNMIKIFHNIFKEYTFYEAIDGFNLELNYEIKYLFDKNDFNDRKGVIGCALSHYNIWIDLSNDKFHDFYLIFEDDIELSDNFLRNIDYSLNIIDKNTDILFLGYSSYQKKSTSLTSLNNNISIQNLDRKFYMGGTFAYIITKNGAHKMLDYISFNGIKHGIDYLIKIVPNLIIQEVNPPIVFSEYVKNINDNIDSDIQKNFNSYNFNDIFDYNSYLFIKNYDFIDHDLQYINTNINQLITISDNLNNCTGFNTLGFLKNKIDIQNLSKSKWFNKEDGIFVKLNKPQRVKMLCNWSNSKELCKDWLNMHINRTNIIITSDDNDIDYYIIINMPSDNSYYNPKKTILFQMEPWVYNEQLNWGVKTWGKWANPNNLMEIRGRNTDTYNNCFWQLEQTFEDLKVLNKEKSKIISSICSSKYFDEGHIKRIDFLKFIESKNELSIDIYNYDNNHNFKNYKGALHPYKDKSKGIFPYKYYFMVENNFEKDFITEKVWEPIIGESLLFYYGCPNLSNYINKLAYIQLDLEDFEGSYKIIMDSIKNNLWEERISIIREEKYKILNYYNFYATIERIICKDLWKGKMNILTRKIKIIVTVNHYKINLFINILKEFGFNIQFILNYSINELEKDPFENYLILGNNLELVCSLNNFFNHMEYLPLDYDYCQLLVNIPPIIIKQYNSYYYNVKKYK